jgi:hypothetical protein
MPLNREAQPELPGPTALLAALLPVLTVVIVTVWLTHPRPRPSQPDVPLRGEVLINVAPPGALQLLPGIGVTTARRIVDYRRAHGPFTEPRQLEAVPYIGPVTRRKLEPWISLDVPAAAAGDGIRLSRRGEPR